MKTSLVLHHELKKGYKKVDASLHCQANLIDVLPKDNEEPPYDKSKNDRKEELFNIINNCKETLTYQQSWELGDVVLTMLKKNYGRDLAALKKTNEELIEHRGS